MQAWLARPSVEPLELGPRHAELLRRLFEATEVAGALVTDTHLAALALEHQAELHSKDTDFSRFPGLRWRNPPPPVRWALARLDERPAAT